MNKTTLFPDGTEGISLSQYVFTKDLTNNVDILREILLHDDTVRYRYVDNARNPNLKGCVIFIDGMVKAGIISEEIIKPLIHSDVKPSKDFLGDVERKIVQGNETSRSGDIEKIITSVLYGDTLLLLEGCDEGLIINTKGWASRAVSEPDDDKALRGPREGFTEGILSNAALLRRKLLTSDFKAEFSTMGARTNTKICICYLNSLVDPSVLKELKKRLGKINMDGVLSSNYIEEHIKDHPFSLFKTTGTSEKPDIVAAKLLEGRVAILVDGSPVVVTVPYLFIENFQSTDDYYINFYYGSISRLLRIFAFALTISVPALYIALVAFHPEMIPVILLNGIYAAAKGVPFPSVMEAIGMLVVFELLRETGIRTPNKVGHALSIVGALVVGQAAVEAKLVSAPMVIVVALTGITGLMLPKVKGAIISIRFLSLFSAAFVGLFGYLFCMLGLIVYLNSMTSFGVNYTEHFTATQPTDFKDVFIRVPWPFMKNRPNFLSANKKRSSS